MTHALNAIKTSINNGRTVTVDMCDETHEALSFLKSGYSNNSGERTYWGTLNGHAWSVTMWERR